MRKILILLLFIVIGCNMSDETSDLGNGYTLVIEGRCANRILSDKAEKKGIQHDVIEYAFSDDYIVAKQKPDTITYANDDDVIDYPDGRDKIYYWIILKENHERIGPLNETGFNEVLRRIDLPSNIEWQSIY